MPIRITGMNSGLDTDLIIRELMRGQRAKVDTLKGNQISNQWRQDAWQALNTKALKLFNGAANAMRFSDAYAKKTSKVSNAKASVVTGGAAVNGVQRMTIDKLATTGYLTGGKVERAPGATGTGAINANTRLSELGVEDGSEFTVKVGSRESKITVGADTTIQSVVNQLRGSGLNANFDAGNGRFFISSPTMGEAGDFSLTANNENGFNAMTALGINYIDSENSGLEKAKYQALYDLKDDRNESNLAYKALVDAEVVKLIAADTAQRDADQASLDKINERMQARLETYREYLEEKGVSTSGMSDEDVLEEVESFVQSYNDGLANLEKALADFLEDPEIDEEDPEFEAKFEAAKLVLEQAIADYKEDPENAPTAKLNYEAYDLAAYGADVITRDALEADIQTATTWIEAAQLDEEDPLWDDSYYRTTATGTINNQIDFAVKAYEGTLDYSTGATRIAGADAEITLNGATFTSSTNTFNINGLTITANQLTDAGEEITITTEDDTEGIYNMVRDFIKEYNILINEMDRLYNAESAKDYKPLTDEEKESMSESEIEKWEEKIKDSLLRRDSSLLNISSAMKSAMSGPVSVGGKNMYLSDFGIEALDYFLSAANEKSALYIDGDEDSAQTSGKANKLKEWIANDSKSVTDFFTGLARNLYGAMNDIILDRNSDFKSINTIYNDKQLKREYDNFGRAIEQQEAKLIRIEDKYYKQFSAMEVAMSKMQSSQNALMGLMGMAPQR